MGVQGASEEVMPPAVPGGTAAVEVVVRVFGALAIERGGDVVQIGGPRIRRLLALLLLRPGSTCTVDELTESVWDDDDRPEIPEPALRTYVLRLRRELPVDLRGAVVTVSGGYRWAGPPEQVEHVLFDHLRREAAEMRSAGDPSRALGLLDEALARWRGRPFVSLDNLASARGVIEGLGVDRLETEEERFEVELELGRHTQIVGRLTGFASEHPTRDRAVGQLALALHRSGRTTDAIRVLHDHRRHLRDASGLEPSAALAELEHRLLDGDPTLDPPGHGVPLRGYRLLDRIGSGTFSVVWRAVQPSVGREVAVKQIRAELATQGDFVRRFESEAQLVARIEHPHIVPLVDFWRDPDSAYLVMRLLRGGSLEERLRSGPLPLDDALRLVDQIGGALAAAHARGVIHRDVKTGNVLFDEDGAAYLADFGIAMDTTVAHPDPASLSAGTPAFASPEQQAREPVDVRADVYSLGIVAVEALHGGPGRGGPRPIESLRSRDDVPFHVIDAVVRATEPDRADRFPTVHAFLDALQREPTSASRPSPPGANPYRGLRAFEEADAEWFFGRDRLVDELVRAMADNRVVTLVGPSGSGKSSVVRAGLLPRLRAGGVAGSDRWFVATMTPGGDPFGALATALEAIATRRPHRLVDTMRSGDDGIDAARSACGIEPGHAVLLIIDQLEELATAADPRDAEQFLTALTAATSTPGAEIRVLATLRADHYDLPLAHATFADQFKRGAVDVTPLLPDELDRAIVGPASAVGVDLEPGLLARIIADAHGRPAVLPLLQHLLRELYKRRIGALIPASAYDDLGGVGGALAATAERLHRDAEPEERAAIRRTFGALVAPAAGDDLKRRVRRSALCTDDAENSVIDRYAAARLLTLDHDPVSREPTVEVTHEALLRSWPRLACWLADDRELLSHVSALQAAADRWDDGGRSPADLLRGVRLLAGTELSDSVPDRLRPVDSALVTASTDAAEAQATAEAHRASRLQRLVAVAGVALVVALVAAVVAIGQWNRADDEAAAARTESERAESAAAAAHTESGRAEAAAAAAAVQTLISRSAALAQDDAALSTLLALEAHRRAPSTDTESAVLSSLVSHGSLSLLSAHDPPLDAGHVCDTDGPLSHDGRFLYPVIDGRLIVHDIRTGTQRDVGAHPDGCGWWQKSSTSDRFLTLDRSEDRFRFGTLGAEGAEVSTEVAVPEESDYVTSDHFEQATLRRVWLAEGSAFDQRGWLVDTETTAMVGRPIEGLVQHSVMFSPDGSLLALYSGRGTQPEDPGVLRLIESETGAIRWTVDLPRRGCSMAFDLDAGHLLAGTCGGSIVTLALADGTTLADVPSGSATCVCFLSLRDDGLVVATLPNRISVIDRFSGPRSAPSPVRDISMAVVAPDGTVTVLTTDRRTLVYDLDGGAIVDKAFPMPERSGARYRAGYLIAIDSSGGGVDQVNVETDERGTVLLRGPDDERLPAAAVVPADDGSFVTVSSDLSLARWVDGELVGSTATGLTRGSSYHMAAGSRRHLAVVENTANHVSIVHRFRLDDVRHLGEVRMDTLAAGAYPAAAGGVHVLTTDGEFRTYDRSGELIRRFDAGSVGIDGSVDASADGSRLVFGGWDGLVVVDPENEQSRMIEDARHVVAVGLTPDGVRAVVGTRDGVYRLWDLEEERAIGVLHEGSGASMGPPGIEEDGRHAWLSVSGRVIRVPIDPDAWIARACEVVDRELSDGEWNEHVPGDVDRGPVCA